MQDVARGIRDFLEGILRSRGKAMKAMKATKAMKAMKVMKAKKAKK